MQQNSSGLRPQGRAILVQMIEPKDERKNALIEIPEMVRENMQVMQQKATVIEVGCEAWRDEGVPFLRLFGYRKLRAKPGDKVIVTKFAGYVTRGPADGQLYRMVNDRDIFCTITKENDDG